jgi:hypothetical protein
MAITTYAELQTNIALFLNRDDLTAITPTFIAMAEANINRDLRHWKMEIRAETIFDERYETLPLDWIEASRISVDGDTQVDLVSQAKMLDYREESSDAGGMPLYYTISAGQIEFYPTPDDSYDGSMIYMAKVPDLNDTDTSNWLLLDSPDVYLYGSLIHSAPYLIDDKRIGVWAGMYQNAINGLNDTSKDGKFGGSGLVMR